MKYKFLILLVLLIVNEITRADSSSVKFPGISGVTYIRPILANQINTPHFKIHFQTPTTQTYAQNVADFAEYSYSMMVINLGWQSPPPDNNLGGDNKYDIYIVNESYIVGYNGITQAGK